MYKIIKRYCENDKNNGLLLIDMPTGCGKTYSVVEYLAEKMKDKSSDNKRKYFFITTLKKNLPVDELKLLFETPKEQEIFEKKFLRVDSNLESVIEGLSKQEVKDTIPHSIKNTDEYKRLESDASYINKLRNNNKNNQKQSGSKSLILSRTEELARLETEPNFRKMLEYRLVKEFPNKNDRKKAIRENKNWKWIKELYPSVLIKDKDKQVIFMSVDKFLVPLSLIVESSVTPCNSSLIDNAVIFIDEIDATKDTVLKSIISNYRNKRIDQIEFFRTVYSALHSHEFPDKLTKPSLQWKPSKYESPLKIIEKLKEMSEQIYNEYSLCYNYKTEHTTDKSANNFLFQDTRYYSILNGNKSCITWNHDNTELANIIKFSNEFPTGTGIKDIRLLIGELNGFSSYFLGAVGILARNYQQARSGEANRDELTLEEAISTVLSEFNLNEETKDRLTGEILSSTHKNKIQTGDADILDMSFYERGFRYYAFEDGYDHDTLSKIMSAFFTLSPEKMLLQICKRAKVVGISATATNPSVIGNYDLSYIKAKLDDKYVTITPDERNRLKATFQNSIKGYNKVDIHVVLTGWDDFSLLACEDVVGKAYASDLFNKIEQWGISEHGKLRYLRIASAFNFFLTHPDIMSFLCVLTKHPRKDDRDLDLEALYEIFGLLVKITGINFNVDDNVVQLDSDEYDAKKNDINERLYKGKKLFVISVYQTIGAGQNLQYPIPDALQNSIVTINDRSAGKEKDYDAIYLDKPTNLITNTTGSWTYEDFLKYIFQIEMLQENGEISVDESETLIKNAFRRYYAVRQDETLPKNTIKINDKLSVIQLSTKTIIQAVGRICRTNRKSPNIYILADKSIKDRIDYEICKNGLYNVEFQALLKELKKYKQTKKMSDERLAENARLSSNCAHRYIISLLKERWTPETIRLWEQFRDFVLRHPTISEDQLTGENAVYRKFYVELPSEGNRIFYMQENDYKTVSVFFEQFPGLSQVSAHASKLPEFMKDSSIRKHFEEKGWATSFVPNKYIMSPPLFNNIYRGVLGEVVGKFLFERELRIKLQNIDDPALFEKFDYRIPNTPIYVDFKNWHEGTVKKAEEEIRHIVNKAKDCNAKCVIVANILARNKPRILPRIEDGIEIVIIPMLIDKHYQAYEKSWEKINECKKKYSN